MIPLVASTGAAAITFIYSAKASDRHNLYPYGSAVTGLAWPDSPDLPHPPEPDMTFYSPLVAAGTATTNVQIGPVRSETWDGSERYGRYGPNILEINSLPAVLIELVTASVSGTLSDALAFVYGSSEGAAVC